MASTEIVRPDPDPTVLTTQQLQREVGLLREVIDTRLDAMDKAITLLQAYTDKSPSIAVVDESVRQLEKLHSEKFKSVAQQFLERDTRTEQTSRDSKVAVDAALQAAKEAVGEQNKSNALAIAKSEAAFTKQIDQIGTLISTMSKGFDDKIDDIKERLTIRDGHAKGSVDTWAIIVGALGAVGVVVTVILAVFHHT